MRSNRAALGVLCVPLLLVAGCATPPPAELLTAAYPAQQCASCAEWNAPQEPFRIFGDTWYVGTHGLASILITSPDGHVLIDGGLPNSAPLILDNIRALGFDIADVRLILNSHPHYDHAGGLAALQRASGARVAASAPSAAVLEHGRPGPDDPQFAIHLDFPPVADVRALAEGEAVAVGPLSLTPHLTAGHTPGGTTWTWRACEADDCLDLVYADSQTPVSADGFRFTGSPAAAGFERGSALLERLPCDILITPHPGASSFWERRASAAGLIDRGACKRYAESARQQLARRLAAEAAPSAPGADPAAEVIAASRAIVEAFGRDDSEAYFRLFDPEATFIFHTTPQRLESRAAYEAEWAAWRRDLGFRVRSCTSREPRVQLLGDVAILTHLVRTEITTTEGDATLEERETIVFRRTGGRWIAVHEHLSPAPDTGG